MGKNKPTAMNVVLFRVNRLKNSVDGNPRFEFVADKGIFITGYNSAFGWEVENLFKVGSYDGRHVELTLDNGSVIDAKVK